VTPVPIVAKEPAFHAAVIFALLRHLSCDTPWARAFTRRSVRSEAAFSRMMVP
jgi:hypothetical protein